MTATTRPCADLSSAAAVRFVLTWQLVGLLLMASHVVLVKQSILFAPLALIAFGWLYANAPLAGFIVFLQILIYQNWIIGLLVDGMAREPTFIVLQGTNFAALVVMAMIAWTRLARPARRDLQSLLLVVAIALVVAVIYTGVGAAKEGFISASIYFRSTTALTFGVLVGLDLGRVYGFRTLAMGFLVSIALSIVLAYIEILAPEAYYDLTNAVAFNALKSQNDPKFSFYSWLDIIALNKVVLFNISGSDSVYEQVRFIGTVMHSISYAYIVATAALLACAIGYGWWLIVLLPLLAMSGVKGANLLFLCSMSLWCVWSLTRSRFALLLSGTILMVGYVSFGIIFGQDSGDYHVIGFMGGLSSLFSDPLGHGIGVGGNLSGNAAVGVKWQNFQHTGATFALESAVGVLFYQMGVASVSVFAVFIMLLKKAAFRLPAIGQRIPNRYSLLFIALGTVAVNGVFQEEAYAPTAAGIFTLLAAVIIANGDRPIRRLSAIAANTSRVTLVHV